MSALLEMRGISKSYGSVQANAGIDLTVMAGSIVGLLGENGSGKSTLMKILFGMVRPDHGAVVFRGAELPAGSPREALRAGRQFSAPEDDSAVIRPHHPEQDLHQGAFARAVLAEQPDDRPGHHGQVDPGIGLHGTI